MNPNRFSDYVVQMEATAKLKLFNFYSFSNIYVA